MCGISGVIIKNNDLLPNINSYNNCLIKYLHNRGPDQKGIYINNNLSFIHNRLAINDLDSRSKQPFFFKNLIMIFNGEIYNFNILKKILIEKYQATFIGTSDTEILIQLFYFEGIDKTLELLNGIFAIALYNIDTNDVVIIRDRIGIKYCYYYEDENIFMFASNPGAIVKTLYDVNKIKFDLNIDVMFSYLSSGICLSSQSLFKNIIGIESGKYLKMNTSTFSFHYHKWWNPNFNREDDNLEKYIQESIDIQEIGDVKKNVLYSGGIDSNIIANYSKKSEFITLPVGEEQYANKSIKELKKNNIKTIHSNFLKENINNFITEQRKIINFSGIPIKASYLMNMTGLYLNQHEKKSKVLLTGIGGNELFYGHRRIKFNSKGFKNHVRDLYVFLSQIKPLDNKYKEQFLNFKKNLTTNLYKNINIPENLKDCNIPRWLEIQTFLLNDLLMNADNIYMYYSIEARVPLLDHNIFEIALSKHPKDFFYDFDKLSNTTWNEYTTKSKKVLKEILLKNMSKEMVFKEKFSYDIERHKIHNLYTELCKKFMERKIIGWNGAFTKYNSPLIGNLELWFQEYEYLITY